MLSNFTLSHYRRLQKLLRERTNAPGGKKYARMLDPNGSKVKAGRNLVTKNEQSRLPEWFLPLKTGQGPRLATRGQRDKSDA
jgi:hypothetical protein